MKLPAEQQPVIERYEHSPQSGKRVAMLVWNEFRHDARVLREAESLQGAGMRVTVFALHVPGVTLEQETLTSGVEVSRVSRRPYWGLRKKNRPSGGRPTPQASGPIVRLSLRRQLVRIVARLWTHLGLFRRIVRSRPDVVHAHDVNVLPTAWLAAKLSRARLIYDAHEISVDREGYQGIRGFIAGIERRLMSRADATITTTGLRAKFFARAYGVPRPAVLQNRCRFSNTPRNLIVRTESGLTRDWPIVLYQGGLQQGRGLELLVRAAGRVPGAYFILIGGGRLESRLKSMVREAGLDDRVRFIPTMPLNELPAYTASADIGVQPLENTCLNHFTTDSNKLFEYAMAGLPVVASDFPEIRKVVKTYQLGLLFDPEVPGALVAALKRLVESAELRHEFSRNAALHREALSWESQEHKLVELYQRLLAQNHATKRQDSLRNS